MNGVKNSRIAKRDECEIIASRLEIYLVKAVEAISCE